MISLDRNNPAQVTSWSDIEAPLIDRSRRLRILSGIAVPDFYVNDDDTSHPDRCVVNLRVTVADFLQATCQVGLASITNNNTAFTFGLFDCSVTADQSGELSLTVDMEARGEKTSLLRFGFQIVALCGNRTPGVSGQVRWARTLLPTHGSKTVHPAPIDVASLLKIHAFVPMPSTSSPGGNPFGSGPSTPTVVDLGYTVPSGDVHNDGDDSWVGYTFENLPLGVQMHIEGRDPSPRFISRVDVTQISGPYPVLLTASHLTERVDFRIARHEGEL